MTETKPAVRTSPAEYLKSLPEDRRKALTAVRKVINDHLPKGYREGVQYGMIGWSVPHSIHPAGYHCDPRQPVPFVSVASQKNHMALYLFCVYMDAELLDWFVKAWKATGKKLDMGKSCVRFKRIEDVPLDVVGELVSRVPVDVFLKGYLSAVPGAGKAPAKKAAAKTKVTAKKKVSSKKVSKKVAKKTAKKVAKRGAARSGAGR